MKKIFLLALTFALIWVCASALAENRLTLPASTKTIEAEAFMNNTAITEVVIPEGCVSIGKNAFAGCVNITTVYMPESVQNIEENAFADCDKLEILLERGSYAQVWCKSNDISYTENVIATPGLTYRLERGNAIITGVSERDVIDLFIPSSIDGYQVTAIDHNAFSGRNDIQGNLFIANGIKSIGYLAFAGCTGLVGDLYFPDSILEIGYFAFESCSGFDGSLILPMNLSSLGYGAFSKCSGFSGVLTIPHNIQAIYECTFWGCTGFSGDLIIPENVTIIGREAFCGCSGFTGELIISDSVTSIAIGAFQNCSGFSSVQIGKSVTSIGSIAFSGLSAVHGDLIIPNSVLSIGSSAFSWSGWDGKLTLSENLSSISEGAFKGVQFSGILQIPANTKSIETDAFFNCTHLETVVFEEGLERIAGGAFRDCTGLSGNIVFPDSLRIIETHGGYDNYGAFVGCTGITGVQFGKSMESIGTAAFSSCNSLQTIIWGESIKNISNNAFWNCSEINMEFYLPAAIETIGSGAFLGCSKLYGNLAIPNSVTFIGQDAFKNCTGLNGYLTISEQLTSISWGAFENCSGLHGDLIIPDSVTQIHDFAFAGCTGFTSLTLSQNLTYLSGGVFYNCTGFTGNLVLPSTLTKIDASYRGWFGVYHAGTFENCTGFGGNLIIPDSIEIIEMNAFKGCTGISGDLVISDSVTSIGAYAFTGCSGLASIILPSSLDNIGSGAFADCNRDFTIICQKNTTAESYAINNTIKYIAHEPISSFYLHSTSTHIVPGEKVEFLTTYLGGSGNCEYKFELYKDNLLVSSTGWDRYNYASVIFSEIGSYYMIAYVRDNIFNQVLYDFSQSLTVSNSGQEGEDEEPEDHRIEIVDMTKFGSSLYWPIYEGVYKDYCYNLRIAWKNNTEWTEGITYNVYLTNHSSDETIVKLNAIPVSDTSILFFSDQLKPFLQDNCGICCVYVRIEIIDAKTGEILCTVTNEKVFRTVVLESHLTYEQEMLKLCFQYSVSLHDCINRGGYQIGDVYTPSFWETASFYTAEAYKVYSGAWQDMNVLPWTRGAMLADYIMREAAKKMQPSIEASSEMFEFFLDYFGLCWDGLTIDMTIIEHEVGLEEFLKEVLKKSDVENVFKNIKDLDKLKTDDLIKQIALAWWNFIKYGNVQIDDVQKYIDIFDESDDLGLQFSAFSLRAMTGDWQTRLMYHIGLHGGYYYLIKLVSSTAYNALADYIIPEGGDTWEALVKVANYVGNAVFNAQGVFDSSINLHAICNLAEETRNKYERSYQLFVEHPVAYYDQFIHEKEKMLSFLEIEYNYYVEAHNQVYASPINSFLIGLPQFFMGKPIGQHDIPVEEYLADIRNWIDPAIESYYNIWVAPIRN